MSLRITIEQAMKKAMLSKDKERTRALRNIKSAIMLEETKDGGGQLTEETEVKILSKMLKQRLDSLETYKAQNRADLAAEEASEAKVIEEFLPKQLSEAELEVALQKIITDTGASTMADMGKIMGLATKQLAGKADGRAISQKVKQMLG